MKTNHIFPSFMGSLAFLLGSCQTPHTNDGIYEGILPAADCPGIYVMLAINGDQYELLEKYIAEPETFVTRGNIEQKGKQLHLDNQMQITLLSNELQCQHTTLKKISGQNELPEIYVSQLLKEDQSGEDASIKLYSQKDKQYAEFHFKNNTYQLKLNLHNDSVNEYTCPEQSVKLSQPVPQLSSFQEFIFRNDTATYTFTQLSPTNCIYRLADEKKENEVPAFLNVIYYNDDQQALVKLLHPALPHCYTLSQTEASAKTANYTDGETEWQLHNDRRATLVIHHKKYQYLEEE